MDRKDRERKERAQRLAAMQKKKKEEEALTNQAFDVLGEASKMVAKRRFKEAGELYTKGGNIFMQVKGWENQAQTAFNEATSMEKREQDFLKQKQFQEEKKKKENEIYQKREQALLARQRALKAQQEAARNRLSPEIQRKIEECEFVLTKAKDREDKGKYPNAIKRYTYALELYKELGFDESRQQTLQNKIEELKNKVLK
jgi:hypothetical protein